MTLPLPPLVTCGVPMFGSHWLRVCVRRTSSETVRLVVTANEVSWEMQVGKQARHYCPVGGGRIIKHPPHINSLFWGGTPLASVTLVRCLQGCIIASKSTYGSVHIGNVLIIHHFFERHFAIGFSDRISMSSAKKIFRPMAQHSQPFYIHTSWQINNT